MSRGQRHLKDTLTPSLMVIDGHEITGGDQREVSKMYGSTRRRHHGRLRLTITVHGWRVRKSAERTKRGGCFPATSVDHTAARNAESRIALGCRDRRTQGSPRERAHGDQLLLAGVGHRPPDR